MFKINPSILAVLLPLVIAQPLFANEQFMAVPPTDLNEVRKLLMGTTSKPSENTGVRKRGLRISTSEDNSQIPAARDTRTCASNSSTRTRAIRVDVTSHSGSNPTVGSQDSIAPCEDDPVVNNLKTVAQSEPKLQGGLSYPIEFEQGRSTLSRNSLSHLSALSAAVKQDGLRLLIEGHADASGDEQINFRLSRDRAVAVANAMVDLYGVSPLQLHVVGKGATEPIFTPPSNPKNRRVLFRLVTQ